MFSNKVQRFAMLICGIGIVFAAGIFTACNKDDDDNADTNGITKKLTHFTISSNTFEDTYTYYYQYDELGRIVAINSYITFQFSYVGNTNIPEILRRIERPDRPNQYEDFKMIYNENGIPTQIQKTGTLGNDYTQNITYHNHQFSFSHDDNTNFVIEDPNLDKGTFSKYRRNHTSYTYHYASGLKNGLTEQHRLDLFMALISPDFNYSTAYLTGYFFSTNVITALDISPSSATERIEIDKSDDGYITKRKIIERGGNFYTTEYFYE